MSEKSIPVMKPNCSDLKRGENKRKRGIILDLMKKVYLELMVFEIFKGNMSGCLANRVFLDDTVSGDT